MRADQANLIERAESGEIILGAGRPFFSFVAGCYRAAYSAGNPSGGESIANNVRNMQGKQVWKK